MRNPKDNIKKIKYYTTTDGEIFANKKDAMKHENMDKFIEWYYDDNEIYIDDGCIDVYETMAWLEKSKKEILKLFNIK